MGVVDLTRDWDWVSSVAIVESALFLDGLLFVDI